MKIKQITETTTAGSIATVNAPLGGTQSRGNPSIYGGKKVGTLFKGKKTSAPYANSVNESAELSEADLSEQDLIVVPGQGRKSKTGFVPHGESRLDHEVEMARSDLFSAAKNAQQVYSMIKDLSEEEGLDGWVQEKIIKANDYLNTIREYLEGKQLQGVDEADMSRRGFLKGLGAAALGAVAGNALAGTSDPGYVKKVQEKHFEMAERNPKYAKEHQALGLLFSRGITGNAAETNKQWAIKTAELLQKYGVTVNEGVTENNQRGDSLVTDSLKIMRGAEVSDAILALKTVLGDREYNSRRGFYNFYVRQMIDAYGQKGVAESEENKYGSQENWDSLRKDIRSQYPYKKGTTVTVPHKGKLVNGKIVRYEAGGGGYSPAYVVDIGEYESIMVEPNKVRRGVAEGKRNLKCVCKTHGTMQCPVHTPKDIDVLENNKNKKA